MQNTLDSSACAALLKNTTWGEPKLLISLSILALINVMVIIGNCLVIAAVFCSSKLRSVTNLFIVSLAVADLLVGVAVLPFSTTRELFNVSGMIYFIPSPLDKRDGSVQCKRFQEVESLQHTTIDFKVILTLIAPS